MRILHIITSLETGGGQWVLTNLVKQLKLEGYEQYVISMKPRGELIHRISSEGIPVKEISFSSLSFFKAKTQCEDIISQFKPDIIQSWFYHADFLTTLLKNPNKIPILWGIHHSYEKKSKNRLKIVTRLLVRWNAIFSKKIPQKIICCSMSAMQSHLEIGFDKSKMEVIENGINEEQFKPDPRSREILRKELGLQPDTKLIGYIARFHPQKDHVNFFQAAEILFEKVPDVHFVLAGNQVDKDNPQLIEYLKVSSCPSHFHFLGRRDDIPLITSALDIATLASSGDEALPLTILEAMASGVICVATDVGDIRRVVGTDGIIVAPQNPKALAEGWYKVLAMNESERHTLEQSSREQVLEKFTTTIMANRYIEIYNEVKAINPNV